MLWRCWLGGRKGIRPVKHWVVGCGHGYLSGASWRLAYVPAGAIATHCLASVKSRSVLPFWYRLIWVVPDKGPLNECMYVCTSMYYNILLYKIWCCQRTDTTWHKSGRFNSNNIGTLYLYNEWEIWQLMVHWLNSNRHKPLLSCKRLVFGDYTFVTLAGTLKVNNVFQRSVKFSAWFRIINVC